VAARVSDDGIVVFELSGKDIVYVEIATVSKVARTALAPPE
jgi:hypothetical protein